ncbi:MAG: penicillin-binding protein 2 [Pseudomonadota bacterium]
MNESTKAMLRAILKGRRQRPTVRLLNCYSCRDALAFDGTQTKLSPIAASCDKVIQDRRLDNKGAARRIQLCAGAFLAAYVLLGGRLWSVSTDAELRASAEQIVPRVEVPRPDILDRNGKVLATNLPTRRVQVAGHEVWSPEETIEKIALVIPDLDRDKLAQQIEAQKYRIIPTDITPAEEKRLFEMGLPGVSFVDAAKRIYPRGNLAGHFVGFAAAGRGGIEGLEAVLDTKSEERLSTQGFVSSMDMRVQDALEHELMVGMSKYNAEAAWGGVMDVTTGEILAFANVPSFDPNMPGKRADRAHTNTFIHSSIEHGSIFKVFTAAAALEKGAASESSVYDISTPIKIATEEFEEPFRKGKTDVTFSEVLKYSSNLGAISMGQKLTPEGLKSSLADLGLLEKLDVPLKEKGTPQLPQKWGPVETATVSFGHGISVTPLHTLSAFSAVVNGGVYRKPVFQAVRGRGNSGRRVFSEETSAALRRALRTVVTGGTAQQAEAPGYYPIGKTGTAEKIINGRYADEKNLTTFVGAFPGYSPRYAILLSYDEPKPEKGTWSRGHASSNAAPTFAALIKRIGPMLNVPPHASYADVSMEATLFNAPPAQTGGPATFASRPSRRPVTRAASLSMEPASRESLQR